MRTYGKKIDKTTGVVSWICQTTESFPTYNAEALARRFIQAGATYNSPAPTIADVEAIWLTTLNNNLQMKIGESPFFGNWGVPIDDNILGERGALDTLNELIKKFQDKFSFINLERLAANHYQVQVVLANGELIKNDVNFVLK